MTTGTAAPPLVHTRALIPNVEVRAIDPVQRRATFVAATQNGVQAWDYDDWGPITEYLIVSGADLSRYVRNPVILDTHNRDEASAVVGNAAIRVEGTDLVAEVKFADTQRALDVWKLVEGGYLRALSVGFVQTESQKLGEGETADVAGVTFVGPARLVTSWELYEISVVPVPADPDALRRALNATETPDMPPAARAYLQRLVRSALGDHEMAKKKDEAAEVIATPPAADEPTTPPAAPAPPAEDVRTAPDIETPAILPEPIPREIVARDIRAICPRGLEAVADECILKGLDLEAARTRLIDELAKRQAPAG
ncbi:MAG TPA: HK97 family phage prohead protease, partial [Phycisphaerae bacterium]|nr:HK97 family phage prohead protease [Phycisphaerae bacterium]